MLVSCVSKEEKLLDAVSKGNLDLVKELVDDGASINIKNDAGLSLFDLAEQSENDSIRQYLYSVRTEILDNRTTTVLMENFSTELGDILRMNAERKQIYQEYLKFSEELLSEVDSDSRLSDKVSAKMEANFKRHQAKFKEFINAKADLIDKVMELYISENYLKDINDKEIRKIVNVKILTELKE